MHRFVALAILALVAALSFCSKQSASEPPSPSSESPPPASTSSSQTQPLGHVTIDSHGVIFYDGEKVSLTELKSDLHNLKLANGVIVYSRDHPYADPTPAQMAAFAQVADISKGEQLPIKFK